MSAAREQALELRARVRQMRYESVSVLSVELVPVDESARLPDYAPGAHIDVELAEGLRRSYSLLDLPDGRRYQIAIHRDPESRGASSFVHERLRVGDVVTISAPRNNFPLDERAAHSVLIAGGIGVTPLLCMARRLAQIGAKWSLYYAARTRPAAAFLPELAALDGKGGAVDTHFDEEAGGVLNLADIVARAPPGAHFYCCGPAPMLAAFKAATSALEPGRAHLEYFAAEAAESRDGGFEVVLARKGLTLLVEPGKTILETLIAAKVDVPYSCSDGVCGTCETRVLEGVPDHRDSFLTEEEKEAGQTIMVCCSGSKSARLVLDR